MSHEKSGDSLFSDLGLDTALTPNGVGEFFDSSSFLPEAIFREIAQSDEVRSLTSALFHTPEAAYEMAGAFSNDLTKRLKELHLLNQPATFIAPEISVRRRYVVLPQAELTENEEEVDDEQPEPKVPKDPATLVELQTTDLSITGELALLPANRADFQDNAIITGPLNRIVAKIIEVKDDPDDECEKPKYRVELYYRVLTASLEDLYEDTKIYALVNIQETEVTLEKHNELSGFKAALMALDNLDENGESQGEPMVSHQDLLSLVRMANLDFDSLRFSEGNITDVNYLVCSLVAEYKGKEPEKLKQALELLLSTCFRIGPQSHFYVEATSAIKVSDQADDSEEPRLRALIGKVSGIVFDYSNVKWRRGTDLASSTGLPDLIPHLVITQEKNGAGRRLSADSKHTFLIPLASIRKLVPRFSEVY